MELEELMELQRLIVVFKNCVKVSRSIDLDGITLEEIREITKQFEQRKMYSIAGFTEKYLQEFVQAGQESEDILNSYVDERVKVMIEFIRNSCER